jgi:hypothetical protein
MWSAWRLFGVCEILLDFLQHFVGSQVSTKNALQYVAIHSSHSASQNSCQIPNPEDSPFSRAINLCIAY